MHPAGFPGTQGAVRSQGAPRLLAPIPRAHLSIGHSQQQLGEIKGLFHFVRC